MSDGHISDNIPVKDTHDERVRVNNPKITRNEIEDRYLNVAEENLILKKHLRQQEDKIKQLATKLVRLVGDRKNQEKKGDILLEDQKCRISELEAQVNTLRDKLMVARQQLGSYTHMVPGIHKQIKPKPVRNITSSIIHAQSDGSTVVTDHVTHLLLEARAENQALKDRLHVLHGHMSTTEAELVNLKEQITLKEVERQDELMLLRSQSDLENEGKKKKLADNVQIIRLQRDAKRTASWLQTYEAQCRTLEAKLIEANETVGNVEFQLAELQEELRLEQSKCITLSKQTEDFSAVSNQLKEFETRLIALQEENKILKEGHESLVAKALENGDKIKRIDQEESSYKSQIAQLENSIRAELQAKAELIATLNQEKAKSTIAEQSFKEFELKYEQLEETLKNTRVKLEEADAKLAEGKPSEIKLPDSCEGCGRREEDLNEAQWQLVQVREELTKTKNLLKTQISINKEYQKEIEILNTKLEKSESFHHDKLQVVMKILEERADQMTLLEKNLENLSMRPITPNFPPGSPNPASSQEFLTDQVQPIPSLPVPPSRSNLQMPSDVALHNETFDTNSKVNPSTSEIPKQVVTPRPKSNLASTPSTDNAILPLKDSQGALVPTVDIHVDKFVPLKGMSLEGLFVTWEADETARTYSPMVSNGVFNTKSRNVIKMENFPLEGIEVQLHQAVGALHCRMIATAFIVPGLNASVAMHSVDQVEIIGNLFYSCVITKPNPEFQSEPSNEIATDLRNNNIENLEKSAPPAVIETAPIPKPKPRSQSQTQIFQTTEPEPDDEFDIPPIEPKDKSPKKSILRREASFGSPKHVTVNEPIQERENSNKTQNVESEKKEIESVPSSTEGWSTHESENEPYQESSNIERRKKHRKKKPIQLEDLPEDSEMTYSLESVDESGAETSQNVSGIESMEDEGDHEYSNSGMRIEISYVLFNEKCRMWRDPKVKKFFVEYNFLNYPLEELETETSLHKPQPGHRAEFNFVKVFLIDSPVKRKLLREMLRNRKRLRFTLVNEPAENDTIDCEDLGYAYVCFNDILQQNADLTEEEIPIFDAENHKIEIGVMCVSIQAIQVLKSL